MRDLSASAATEPAYLALWKSGELDRRIARALAQLEACRVCPRDCDVDRTRDELGLCNVGRHARVSRGCHNINFVTPEHVVPQLLEALPRTIAGELRLPIRWRTSPPPSRPPTGASR